MMIGTISSIFMGSFIQLLCFPLAMVGLLDDKYNLSSLLRFIFQGSTILILCNISSLFLSRWIIQNCIFDRLYYYGAERPLHISYSNNNLSKIILMRFRKVRVVPQVIKTNDFLNSNINF